MHQRGQHILPRSLLDRFFVSRQLGRVLFGVVLGIGARVAFVIDDDIAVGRLQEHIDPTLYELTIGVAQGDGPLAEDFGAGIVLGNELGEAGAGCQ